MLRSRDLTPFGILRRAQRVAKQIFSAPPPVVREGRTRQGYETDALFRPLKVIDRIQETPLAVSLVLQPLDGKPFDYRPGQHLNLQMEVDGETERRAYSFSSTPDVDPHPRVTIKKVKDGRVSPILCDDVQAGDTIRAMGPAGHFTCEPRPEEQRRLVFIAGGSGITPIFSLIQHLARHEPKSQIELLYGNTEYEQIIFRDALEKLTETYPQIRVHHVLETTPENWEGPAGRLTGDMALSIIGDPAGAHFFLCGPPPMVDGAVEELKKAGVTDEAITVERFTQAPIRHKTAKTKAAGEHSVVFAGFGGRTVPVRGRQTILEAGLNAGLNLDYSCTLGGCGECMMRLVSGKVTMEEPNCLTDGEASKGLILACVAHALEDCTVEPV